MSKTRSSSATTLSELRLAERTNYSPTKNRPLSYELDQSISPSASLENIPKIDHLEIQEVIGKGVHGEVARMTTSQELQSFGKEPVIKFANDDAKLVNEAVIANYIFERAQIGGPGNLRKLVNIQRPVVVNHHLGLVSKESVHGDLQNFLKKNCNSSTKGFANSEIGATICQLFISIMEALNALHSLGVLHFDLAARNCLVKFKDNDYHLKLTDFGLSCIIPSNGVVKIASDEPYPVRALDVRTIKENIATIYTSCFGQRALFIEIIGLIIGEPVERLLTYEREVEEDGVLNALDKTRNCALSKVGLYQWKHDEDKNHIETSANNKSLRVFVNNLMFYLKQKLSLDGERYHQIKTLLDCYKDYLTHLPVVPRKNDQFRPEEINEIRHKDYEGFIRATTAYINTQRCADKYHSLSKELERLKTISITLPPNPSEIIHQLEVDTAHLQEMVQTLKQAQSQDQMQDYSEPNYLIGSELKDLEVLRMKL